MLQSYQVCVSKIYLEALSVKHLITNLCRKGGWGVECIYRTLLKLIVQAQNKKEKEGRGKDSFSLFISYFYLVKNGISHVSTQEEGKGLIISYFRFWKPSLQEKFLSLTSLPFLITKSVLISKSFVS